MHSTYSLGIADTFKAELEEAETVEELTGKAELCFE